MTDLLPTILDVCGLEIPGGLPGKSLSPLLLNEEGASGHDYIFADGSGSAAFFFFPKRSVRDDRYKLIHNPLQDRDNPKFERYAFQMNPHFAGGTKISEIDSASAEVRQAYQTWKRPPVYELYDLKEDPLEFHNLSGDPAYKEIMDGLIKALEKWQVETDDPMADPVKLARYTREVDSVSGAYEGNGYARDPSFEWGYVDYFYSR
jgi:N-sulfoglucosamine sulfohydrolase